MSKAFLRGFYDYFMYSWSNPYCKRLSLIDYNDWEAGYQAARCRNFKK